MLCKILFYGGFATVLIINVVKFFGRHKTGYYEWGEPELDVVQVIGMLVGLVGLFLS